MSLRKPLYGKCEVCIHIKDLIIDGKWEKTYCDAFPDGIPKKIFWNAIENHKEILPNQKGNYIFSMRESIKPAYQRQLKVIAQKGKCESCKHYIFEVDDNGIAKIYCIAFPERIPNLIYLKAREKHTHVLEGQVGNYVYELKEELKPYIEVES